MLDKLVKQTSRTIKTSTKNKRRYGGHVVHFGVVLIFVAIAGSDTNITVWDISEPAAPTLRQTLETLLNLRAVPIINENDTVSTMELERQSQNRSFGDNDKLSALVAGKLDADLLVMLTNVDGIFTTNPSRDPEARRIECIESFERLAEIRAEGESAYGRGGMTTKIEAARIASISGVTTIICSGMTGNPLASVLDESGTVDPGGTLVLAQTSIGKRRRWIGFASGSSGIL